MLVEFTELTFYLLESTDQRLSGRLLLIRSTVVPVALNPLCGRFVVLSDELFFVENFLCVSSDMCTTGICSRL